LALGGPRDKTATEEDSVARGGAASIRAASPIRISVDDEPIWRNLGNDKTKVEGSLKVSKNPFSSNKVIFPGIMHVQADLLDSIGNIRPGEGQILKCTTKAAIGSGVSNWRTSICRDFGTSINGGGAGLAVIHSVAAENVQSILPL
jgi:hypothetical protein